jgi:hypothetical protein
MPKHIPTEETLLNTLTDTFKFLGAIGRNISIAAILRKEGLNPEVLQQGWGLLFAANGFVTADNTSTPTENPTGKALAEVDQADDSLFRRVKVVLQGDFPAQLDFLLEGGLSSKEGAASVGALSTLLKRLDELELDKNKKRPNTREQDTKAIEKLAARGVTAKERERLQGLLTLATSAAPEPEAQPVIDSVARQEALVNSYYWYKEWAEIARDVIKRRDYLIALGLAEKIKRNNKSASETPPKPSEA